MVKEADPKQESFHKEVMQNLEQLCEVKKPHAQIKQQLQKQPQKQ